jgi:hypothetical protein
VSFALVQHAVTVGSSTAIITATYANAQTAGNLNECHWYEFSNTSSVALVSVVDTELNGVAGTYTATAGFTDGAGDIAGIAFAANIAAAGAGVNTVTMTLSAAADGGGTYDRFCICEWSGAATVSPLDGNTTTSSSPNNYTLTTGGANDLIVALCVGNDNQPTLGTIAGVTATAIDGGGGTLVLSQFGVGGAAGSQTITFSGPAAGLAIAAAFKPAAGGPFVPNDPIFYSMNF